MIKGIEHFGLAANSPEKLTEWYKNYLNMDVIKELDNGTFFIEGPKGNVIEIYPATNKYDESFDNYTTGWRHLAIEVENFEKEYEKFIEEGIELVSEPVRKTNLKLALFKDCEGNLFHLTERVNPLR